MRSFSANIILSLYVLLAPLLTYGQIAIDTTYSAEYLVNNVILGSGVLTGNVKFTGAKHAIGIYSDPSKQIEIDSGIVLTSGNAFYVIGPNKSPRTGWAANAPGDKDLDKIARGKTYDASVLEFDFVTTSENLSFKFVFASEEYLEYVGSKFNDVFAFFIEGPGVDKVNIARLPDNNTPITVNTVNNQLNKKFYVDNTYINTTDPYVWDVRNRKVIENKYYLKEPDPPKYNIQFDGFTSVLEAKCTVIPNEVYHIKIAISDVGDGILDSGVFLKAGSFKSDGSQVTAITKKFKKEIELKPLQKISPDLTVEKKVTTRTIPYKVRIGVVEFDFDKYNLNAKAYASVREVFKRWTSYPNSKIQLQGHTDSMGQDDYNERLSKNRSESVAEALIALGVPRDQLIVGHFGESVPLQPNDTNFGRARNRRVELSLVF